jgi:succinoglycan biosynthesis transport protein ExoP
MVENESGLAERLQAIRGRWLLFAAIAIPLFVGASVYAQLLPNRYTSTATLSIEPRSEGQGLQGLAGAELVRVEAPKFVAYVTAPATIQTVAAELGVDPGVLQGSVDANVPTDTGQMSVSVTEGQADGAAAAANALADRTVMFSASDPLLRAVLVAPAIAPGGPSGPPRRLIEAAALVVGLIIALVVVLAVDRVRPRVWSESDVPGWNRRPVIGHVPTARGMTDGPDSGLASDGMSASFRSLATTIRAVNAGNRGKAGKGGRVHGTFVVTSATDGEGKTFVARGLATALTDLGSRVLLIDADTYQGSPEGDGDEDDGGLIALLRGEVPFERCVRPGWIEGLSVIETAPDPAGPTMIARGFGTVLARARAEFDTVIVDSPRVLGKDEATTIATLVDRVVFVVAVGTSVDDVSRGIAALDAVHHGFAGVVINRVKSRARRDREGSISAGTRDWEPLDGETTPRPSNDDPATS